MQSSVQRKNVERKTYAQAEKGISKVEKRISTIDFKSAQTGRKRQEEIALWEVVSPEKKALVNNGRRRQGSGGTVRTFQNGSAQALRRRKARRRRAYLYRAIALSMVVFCLVLISMMVGFIYKWLHESKEPETIPVMKTPIISEADEPKIEAPDITYNLLDINDYSRPGTAIEDVKSIFVHYTANPGTSAAQNRSYFANLELTHERSASAHLIIGYEGEIIQCIPLNEQAYAVMTRNNDSISIECCYLEKDGEFTQETYDSLVHLLAWLKQEYQLSNDDILRHYDCGGKLCPLYYVEHEDAWEELLADVEAYEAN